MRILGIDYGKKRLGIAVSDPLGLTAQGIKAIEKHKTAEEDAAEIKKIIDEYGNVGEIVVGLPKTLKNEIGIAAQEVLAFVEVLKQNIPLPVNTWDERMTTAETQRMFREAGINSRKSRGIIDKSAAALILKSYMDCKKPA